MPPAPILKENTLFYGDNLDILRDYPKIQILTIADRLRDAE